MLNLENQLLEFKEDKWIGGNYIQVAKTYSDYKKLIDALDKEERTKNLLLCQIVDYREGDRAFVEVHCLNEMGFWRGMIDCSDIRYPDREDTVGILKVKPYFKGQKGYFVRFEDARGEAVYLEVPVDNLQR